LIGLAFSLRDVLDDFSVRLLPLRLRLGGETRVSPSLKAAQKRVHVRPSPFKERLRHTGARVLLRSRAVGTTSPWRGTASKWDSAACGGTLIEPGICTSAFRQASASRVEEEEPFASVHTALYVFNANSLGSIRSSRPIRRLNRIGRESLQGTGFEGQQPLRGHAASAGLGHLHLHLCEVVQYRVFVSPSGHSIADGATST
jgi:hypothetical protein